MVATVKPFLGPDISFTFFSPDEREFNDQAETCFGMIMLRIQDTGANIREAVPPAEPGGPFENGVWQNRRIFYTNLNENTVRQIIQDEFSAAAAAVAVQVEQ
jgi:hypothetical protein